MCEYYDVLPAMRLVLCRRGYGSDKAKAVGEMQPQAALLSQELNQENSSMLISIISDKFSLRVQTNHGKDLSEMVIIFTVTLTVAAVHKFKNHLFVNKSIISQIQVIPNA